MAQTRATACIHFNRGPDPALIQDQSLFKYWFHIITNIRYLSAARLLMIPYSSNKPLSRPALIQVPFLFQDQPLFKYKPSFKTSPLPRPALL